MTFSEQDFFQQQLDSDRLWGRVIWIAIALHAAVFVFTWKAPDLFKRKPLLEEVMTIDLVSLPEPAPARQVAKPEPVRPQPVARPPAPEPVQKKQPEPEKVVSVAPEPEPEPEPAPEARPISIRPLKRKIRKAKDLRLDEEKERERLAKREKARKEQELIRRKVEEARRKKARKEALARAREEERKAREAARQARAELAAALQMEKELRGSGRTTAARSGTGRRASGVSSALEKQLEKQYYMDLAGRVQRLWVLPAIKKWPASLETIIEFTVLANGRLVGVKVARSSGDRFFDRFALETVKKASPAPPIPPAIHKQKLDLGFRLRPTGVQ